MQIIINLAQKKFVYNTFKVDIAMRRKYSVKFINQKKKREILSTVKKLCL